MKIDPNAPIVGREVQVLDNVLADAGVSPARDTVEISDAAREAAGGWEYYEGLDRGHPYRRVRGNDSEFLSGGGHWATSAVSASFVRRHCRRLTPAEVDALALSNTAFARKHFAEHQSQEKPDRHLSSEQMMQDILGNVAGALCGGPGGLTESEWDGIRKHFANYAEYKDTTHLSQARFAIDRIIYERQQQARKSVVDGVIGYLQGGVA